MRAIDLRAVGLMMALAGFTMACGGDDHADGEHTEEQSDAGAVADHVEVDTALIARGLLAMDTAVGMNASSLKAVGEVTWLPDRVGMVSAAVPGRLSSVLVASGASVAKGAVLATMESPEIGALQVSYREASELARIAREHYDREARLEKDGIVARRNVLEAEATLRQHELAAEGARARLALMGADTAGGFGRITSPIGGLVLTRAAGPGQMVTPDVLLFTVADLSTVMLEVAVPERDLARVRRGTAAQATVAAWPGRIFRGTVSEVAGGVDPVTRTVVARIEVANRDLALRAGMHASIELAGEGAEQVAAVPADAVQRIDGRQIVFVPGNEPGKFDVRDVVAVPSGTAGWVIIRNGLAVGDRLVAVGAFLLRSELSRGDLEGHAH